jgi:protein-arginine kinase
MTKVLKVVEEKLPFSIDPKLGSITSCPSNLGASMMS